MYLNMSVIAVNVQECLILMTGNALFMSNIILELDLFL